MAPPRATLFQKDEPKTTIGRVIETVPPAVSHRLTVSEIYGTKICSANKPKTDILRDHLKQEGRVTIELALQIINQGRDLWMIPTFG